MVDPTLNCNEISFRQHALKRMIERNLPFEAIEYGLNFGEIIKEYKDDKPFESKLLYVDFQDQIIHIVVSKDVENNICYIITVYIPDILIWKEDFKTKR